MKTRFFLIFALVFLLAAAAYASQAAAPSAKPDVSATPSAKKDACLECHAPFADLAAKPKNFTAESGEKINPHRYVPHDRKQDKNIPVCTNCHKPHQNPFTSKKDVIKPNVEWCYRCHHNNDFQPCAACHK